MARKALAVLTVLLTAVFAGVLPGAPAQAAELDPTETIKKTVDRVIDVLNDPDIQGPEYRGERKQRVFAVIDPVFDFDELSMRTLGRYWRDRTTEEKEEFVEVYTEFLKNFYFDKVDTHETEKIIYGDELRRGGRAEVRTRVVTPKGTEVPIDYRLKNVDGGWLVYDVVIEGVSLVRSYRSQFGDAIRSSSFDNLMKELREKLKEGEGAEG